LYLFPDANLHEIFLNYTQPDKNSEKFIGENNNNLISIFQRTPVFKDGSWKKTVPTLEKQGILVLQNQVHINIFADDFHCLQIVGRNGDN
jgi:hypothetical protein